MIDGDNSSSDNVNHPPHYGGENDTYETIKVIEDLQKSLWYLEYLINKYKSNDK